MIATTVLMGGMIIMVMGVVGMYVGNIFMQTKNRPLYVMRQILNDNANKKQIGGNGINEKSI